MPPKRKRIVKSPSKDKTPTKKFKAEVRNVTLESIPEDCLSEIFRHLPTFSLCAASLTAKRFNNVYEALILTHLSKKFGDAKIAIINLPPFIKRAFFPRGLYLAFEDTVRMVDKEDEDLEKLLSQLNNQILLKINKLNKQNLKKQLSEKASKLVIDKVEYTEISPIDTFALWEDTDSNTNGGKFKVSFLLFGEKKNFAQIDCSVFSYYEHSGGTFTCDIALNAKLMNSASLKKSTVVKGLLEGYKEQAVPEFYSDDEDEDEDNELSEDSEEIFRQQVKKGDRVKIEWWHDCYPTLNNKKLDQVKKWLGWDLPTLEFAQVLAQLSTNPSQEGYQQDIDTKDIKASLESMLKLTLSEDEDKWLNQVERTLDLLYAKIKLKNLIRREWQKKPKAKLLSALSLVDRSMYITWGLIQGRYEPDPDFLIHYKELDYDLKLFGEDPSKWIRVNFSSSLCRDDPLIENDADDRQSYKISSSEGETKDRDIMYQGCTLHEEDVKLIKDELGLKSFTSNEVIDLFAMASDIPLQEIRDSRKKKSKK